MENVSHEFLQEQEKPVMGPAAVEIRMAMADYAALSSARVTSPGHPVLSDAQYPIARHGCAEGNMQAGFEPNRMRVNGHFMLQGGLIQNSDGYVSQEISGADGVFSTPPTFQVEFDPPIRGSGLTLCFDKAGEGCAEAELCMWQGNNRFLKRPVRPKGFREEVVQGFYNITRMTLTFFRTKKPFHRARLCQFLPGLYLTMGAGAITRAQWKCRADPICRRLPSATLSFEIINLPGFVNDLAYDPEEPEAVWKYADLRNPVQLRVGQKITGANPHWEWVNGGEYFLTGRPKAKGMTLSFEASDMLTMASTPFSRSWWDEPIPLHSLFQQALRYSEFARRWPRDERMTFGSKLMQTATSAPIQARPSREQIQLTAHAARCPATLSRNGMVVLNELPTRPMVSIGLALQKGDGPEVEKNPALEKVICPVYQYRTTSRRMLHVGDYQVNGRRNLHIEYPFSGRVEIRYNDAGVDFESDTSCAWADLFCTGNGTLHVEISGEPFEITRHTIAVAGSAPLGSGLVEELDNSLIDSEQTARAVAECVRDELERRIVYRVKTRGYVQLDPMDLVRLQLKNGQWVLARVLENQLEFSEGVLSGTLILKKQ